jgi:hypothetical protein
VSRLSRQCANLNISQSYRLPRPVIAIALLFLIIIIIQIFFCLRVEFNSQWPITGLARIKTTALRQHRTKETKTKETKKNISVRAFYTLHFTLHSRTAIAAETHLADGQWLKEHTVVHLHMFQVGTRKSTVSRTETTFSSASDAIRYTTV